MNPPDYLTGTCYRDSGGPLAAFNASNQLVEIGITTAVPADCNAYTADIFTNVISIEPWVTSWIQALAPPPPSTTAATTRVHAITATVDVDVLNRATDFAAAASFDDAR